MHKLIVVIFIFSATAHTTLGQSLIRYAYPIVSLTAENSNLSDSPTSIALFNSSYYTLWNSGLVYRRPTLSYTGIISSIYASANLFSSVPSPQSLSTYYNNFLTLIGRNGAGVSIFQMYSNFTLSSPNNLTWNSSYFYGSCSDTQEGFRMFDGNNFYYFQSDDDLPDDTVNCPIAGRSPTRVFCLGTATLPPVVGFNGPVWLTFDSVARVFNAYSDTICGSESPLQQWVLGDNSTTGQINSGGFLGCTTDEYCWLFDATQRIYKGYDLNYGAFLKSATTFKTKPAVQYFMNPSSSNQSVCYNPNIFNPTVTGLPINLSDAYSTTLLNITNTVFYPASYFGQFLRCDNASLINSIKYKLERTWYVTNTRGVTTVSGGQQPIIVKGYSFLNSPDPNNKYLKISQFPQTSECSVANWTRPFVLDCWLVLNQPAWLTWVQKSDTNATIYTGCGNNRIATVNRSYSGPGCSGLSGFQGFDPTNVSQLIDLYDTKPPIITVQNYTVNSCTLPPFNPNFYVSVSDDCSYTTITNITAVDAIISQPANCLGGVFRVIKRTISAVDNCNNVATAIQIITVVDTTAPIFTLASNCTCATKDYCNCGILSVSDDCGLPSSYYSTTSLCPGRMWNVTDICGNVATQTQSFVE